MGNSKGEFDTVAQIVPQRRIMIRHNSLESARIIIQKKLEKQVGVANYFFKVNVYPHHIVRENAMATGAGADRVQNGMRKSFGKPLARAARVRDGQPIISVYYNKGGDEKRAGIIKSTLKLGVSKLPGDLKVRVRPNARKAAA